MLLGKWASQERLAGKQFKMFAKFRFFWYLYSCHKYSMPDSFNVQYSFGRETEIDSKVI